MDSTNFKYLNSINSPADLRKIKIEKLPEVCAEVRALIISETSKNPGHLGASLGAVEMAVAIHYVFDTPTDKLIWDVGHQAYAHKILTGRRDTFKTNRTYHGISGFPRMSESEYDAFGTGHSSTSISAALGMAVASSIKKDSTRQHIAIIGDGSMTGGMAMEALNNAGVSKTNLLVILNDNGIAIDKSVGGLAKYLTDITTSRAYNKLKDKVWILMGGNSQYGGKARWGVKKIFEALKLALLKQSNLFEAFGLRYFGPVDGHDVIRLVHLLTDLKNYPGPKLLHVVTVKGKGFEKAEQNQTKYHAPGKFDAETGDLSEKSAENLPPKYQDVFGETLLELALENKKIVGVTPAMPSGCSMNIMMAKIPERAFDVGIAEQHAVTFSAGMAVQGLVPFCNIYSSFMQRAYDQVIHDVALQNLHVIMCLDRGGLVGEDGATHHGVFDLAYLRPVPNLTICSPLNEEELRNMMFTAQLPDKGPWVIRYPRSRGMKTEWKSPFKEIEAGKAQFLRHGGELAFISIGPLGNIVAEVCDELEKSGIKSTHLDIRFLKPLDEASLISVFSACKKIITIEDGAIKGGLGSAVLEFAASKGINIEIKSLGIPDHFIEHGTLEQLHHECGIDKEGILTAAKKIL